MKNLAQALNKSMKDMGGLEKDATIGSGNFKYKGVSDYEVKKLFKRVFQENGLMIIPTSVESKTEFTKASADRSVKFSVFTEVKTKYLLLHTSGESLEIAGYGQGVDSQDKGAGKASTYALKYALLYLGLIPTGKIDDSDKIHSDDITKKQDTKSIPVLTKESKIYQKILEKVATGTERKQIEAHYIVSDDVWVKIIESIKTK